MTRVSRKHLLNDRRFKNILDITDKPLEVFRTTLLEARRTLYEYHIDGAPASEILSANSWLIDRILTAAWSTLGATQMDVERCALLAVGGYGRRELHPHSDIDLLILFSLSPNSVERLFVEHYVRFLWDIGLQVGHSVRTLQDCFLQAEEDVTVLTNMMEARLICGHRRLLEKLSSGLQPDRLWSVHDFYHAKTHEQLSRHHRYNDTAYNLEPHIKEGPGGLRDIHTISWIAQRQFGSRNFMALIEHNFLTQEEYRMLRRGRNFIWRIRNSLHFRSNRCEDRLLFDYQEEIAHEFGYINDKQSLAVEKLMKRYYRTIKKLRFLNDLLLQYFHQEIMSQNPKLVLNLNLRFRAIDGLIETVHPKVFEQQPFALLEIFTLLQQRSDLLGIQAKTIRDIWSSRALVGSKFRKDVRCRTLFMEILHWPSGQLHTLKRMNDYGILGAYIPVFGRIVGQMQQDLFHYYTVDAHLLFVVRNLRRLEIENYNDELPFASSVMRTIYKRHRLFLAALFHDIAKGRGGDHSRLGERDAYDFCRLHDLSQYDSKFVAWLVRHHLLMSWFSQREDISDPTVITKFAAIVGNQERLDNLYVLTISDIRGTNPQIWNDWKGQLLFDLYLSTSRALKRGLDVPLDLKEEVTDIRLETLNFLSTDHSIVTAANKYWDTLNFDYFLRYRPEFIAWHTKHLLSTSVTELPLVAARPLLNSDTAQFLICSPHSDRLLSDITASFDHASINIIDARVHKARSGLIVMIFVVLMPPASISKENELNASAAKIRAQLLNPHQDYSLAKNRVAPKLKYFPIQTEVLFKSVPDQKYTVMEVIAQDRPGLLHQVANSLVACKINFLNARISTFGERAEDIFLLHDRDGGELKSQHRKKLLEQTILGALP